MTDDRELLVALAERYANRTDRPCCDADTTLADWQEVLTAEEISAVPSSPTVTADRSVMTGQNDADPLHNWPSGDAG